MREQIATGEIWGGVELSDHDRDITMLFSLCRTVQSAGMGVHYAIDYAVVKDWCDRNEEDSVEMLMIMRQMSAVLNEKRG